MITAGGTLVNNPQSSADAAFTVNGISITRDTNTISDVITGLTISLLNDGGATSTLEVKINTAPIKETIQDLVESYNETRDLITRIRDAKLNEDDKFGIFCLRSLLRSLFNELRSLTTGGVRMSGAIWDGSVTSTAASANATSITLNNFTTGAGTLLEGDQFSITGDTQIYTLTSNATLAGNSATVSIDPPLKTTTTGGETILRVIRTLEDFGVGVRTDEFSGTDGVLGVIDEGLLDSVLSSDLNTIRSIFTRTDSVQKSEGIARRIYDWLDSQTKISVFSSVKRSIDDIKVPGLEESNTSIASQIERLETRLKSKEAGLIRQFSEMEQAMSRAQSSGSALAGFGG